jgi:hypothetical protein
MPGVPGSGGTDALLRRMERRAIIVAVAATGLAMIVPGGGLRAAAGVIGGALIALTSYWAIKRGVSGVARTVLQRVAQDPIPPDDPALPRRRAPAGGLAFVLRYALLAGMAYVMIARLRLPPIGLLSGASVTMLAAAAELVVWSRR